MFTQEAIAGYLGTAVFTFINLAVIYWFLRRFLFKPFTKVIEKRKSLIESQLDEADEKMKLAQQQEQEIQQRLKDSVKRAAEIVEQARIKAEAQEAKIIRESEEQAQQTIDRTKEEVKRIRSTLHVDMRTEIADLAVAIASKVIGSSMSRDDQYKMVNTLIDQEIRRQSEENESTNVAKGENQ